MPLLLWGVRGVVVIGSLIAGANLFNEAGNASQKLALGAGAVALGYLAFRVTK